MQRYAPLFFVLVAPLLAQDATTLTAQRIAGIASEADASNELHDFFDGNALIRAIQDKIQATDFDATARELARLRVETSDQTVKPARLRAGSSRMFRETGSTNLSSGTTSAVAKTSATEFISLALESGAITSNTDKSTATFQLNALPVWQLMSAGKGPFGCGGLQSRMSLLPPNPSVGGPIANRTIRQGGEGICESGVGFWLRGLTGSVSLNVNSKETAAPVLTTATGATGTVITGIQVLSNPSKLSALGLKYELFQREDDREKQGQALETMSDNLQVSLDKTGLDLKLASIKDKLINDPKYQEWLARSIKGAIPNRNDAAKLEAYMRGQLDEFANSQVGQLLADSLRDIQAAYQTFVDDIAGLESQYLFKKSLAFDFVNSRPTDQPSLNTVRLDFNTPLGKMNKSTGSSASLDFNSAVGFYSQPQLASGKQIRLRNASASIALNYRMASWGGLGAPVFTLAGYYQYMFANSLISFNSSAFTPGASSIPLNGPAIEVLNTKGSIGLGQARLEIPLGADSGLTFPIAISYANRTELIKDPNRKYWQGHIGLSYDLSKLEEALLKRKN